MHLLLSDASWERFRTTLATSPSRDSLQRETDYWLDQKPVTIVDKKHLAPSGDPHDYVSVGPYWWPDPAKPGGLPYIKRDGEVNPEYYEYDSRRKETASHAVVHFILQSYVTGSSVYAEAAGRALKAWYLAPKTRMNPHLNYAQAIPGICEGRGIGIIDTNGLAFLLDALDRLPFNAEWTTADRTGLQQWFSDYLDWLLTSKNGLDESREHNNHGTWYDAQVAAFACFCDRPELAQKQLEIASTRLASQLAPDGSQPHELARTLSLSYCTFNLIGFTVLAQIARRFGHDFWRWPTPNGATLQSAVDWMLPYFSGERPWTHQQITAVDNSAAALLLSLAGEVSGESRYTELAQKLAQHPWHLISFSKASITGRKSLA